MLEDERPSLFLVALEALLVHAAAQVRDHRRVRVATVHVVAIDAPDDALRHRVMELQLELGLNIQVTVVAGLTVAPADDLRLVAATGHVQAAGPVPHRSL